MKKEDKTLLILVILCLVLGKVNAQVDNQFSYKWLKPQVFKDTIQTNAISNPNMFINKDGLYLDSGHIMLRAGFNNRFHTTSDRQGLQMLTNAQAGDSTGFIINSKSGTVFQHVDNSNPFLFKFQGIPSGEVMKMYNDTIIAIQPLKIKNTMYDSQSNKVDASEVLMGNPPVGEPVAISYFKQVSIAFPSIDAQRSEEEIITFSEAQKPCTVVATPQGAGFPSTSKIIISAYVPTNGQVAVRAYNIGTSDITPPNFEILITVLKRQ